MRRMVFVPLLLSVLLIPARNPSTARADILSQPFLTWTVHSHSNYLNPINHLQLEYGTVLVKTSWYFTVQVLNASGSQLDIDQTTGLGETAFFRAPLSCSGGTCYYRIYFEPLISAFASATLYLHAHKSGCSACWYRSAAITVSGTGVAPVVRTPSWGLLCQVCNLSMKRTIPWQTKVQLKTELLDGGTLQLLGRPQSLSQAPLNIDSYALSRLRQSTLRISFAPLKNGEYGIFSRGYWEGFLKPPWNWDADHWLEAFHISHLIYEMIGE
jgi:hypothetical protein